MLQFKGGKVFLGQEYNFANQGFQSFLKKNNIFKNENKGKLYNFILY